MRANPKPRSFGDPTAGSVHVLIQVPFAFLPSLPQSSEGEELALAHFEAIRLLRASLPFGVE